MWTKGFWLFWINVASGLSLMGLMATGVVLNWVLPHGGDGRGRGAAAREWMGLSRHDWGEVHFWISVAFVGLILVHVLMHVGWIKGATLKYLGLRGPRRMGAAGLPR